MNKSAFHKISYGVFVVASKRGDRLNGQIANVAVQVTAEPPKIAVALNNSNLTCEFLKESGIFSVSVLAQETPMPFIGKFGFKSGRETDKFSDTKYITGKTGAPIVTENAVAWFDCRVTESVDVGTHTIFVGEVIDADVLSDAEPMTYAYYHQVKKGYSPPKAPTYQGEKEVSKEPSGDKALLKKYRCSVCGYIYDPEKGDPDGKIPAGTPFENLPDNWTCPVCGVTKDMFKPLE
ncbi:MAG: rubredoxin [candidate division WOR-3 bacterium]